MPNDHLLQKLEREEIFAHILNKALNNQMVEPGTVLIDGTPWITKDLGGQLYPHPSLYTIQRQER